MGFGKDRVTTLEPISWSELETILLEAGAALHDVPDADGLLWMPPDRNDGSGGVPHGREEDWRSAPSTERRSLGEGFVLAGPVDLSLLGAHLFTGESGPKRFQAGDTYEEGLHARLRGGVAWQPHPIVCAAVEARMAAGRTATRLQWTRALAAVRFAGLRLSVGRDSRWWGPGRLEELLLTNNARPGDAIELGTDGSRSLGFLGAYRGSFFLSYLDDPTHPTSYPLLFGQRLGWRPAAWVELGVARTIMLGGAGRTERLKLDNVWDIFLGRRENLVGVTGFADTDQKVEFDAVVYVTPLLTWVPGMKGARLFYEYAGDDSFEGLLPTRVAHLAGGSFLFPRMRLDIETFENVAAGPWYWNDEFPQGYTYRGRFIGSELGWDARSWRARSAFAISPDWGVRAEAIWDGKGYEFHQGDRLRPVREGGRYSDAFEASLSVAHRMRPGRRLVVEYRFRNPRHGFTFEHDRRYPRHVFGVALRVG